MLIIYQLSTGKYLTSFNCFFIFWLVLVYDLLFFIIRWLNLIVVAFGIKYNDVSAYWCKTYKIILNASYSYISCLIKGRERGHFFSYFSSLTRHLSPMSPLRPSNRLMGTQWSYLRSALNGSLRYYFMLNRKQL